jgi:glycosyltransferase involved in cell wall biosynthesis
MNIAIDGSRLAVGQRTGTESYTTELVRALAALDRRNDYTLYFNQLPAALPPLGANWRLRALPAPRLWTHARLGPAWQADRPDVAFVPAHVLPLARPRRSVVTIHDLGYERHPEAHPRAQRLYLRLSTRWSARAATHLIAISEATRRDLITFTGANPDKISVVYHGVHPRFRPIDPAISAAVARAYGLDGPYMLFISTIQPRKNLTRLIDAYAWAARIYPDLPPLALGGKPGWLTEQIERRAGELGVAGRVRFLGYVADADLPALLGGASIYLLPSLYEGFGMTVLEAMACGAPVITSNVSSLPEVAGDAAILVDPADTALLAQAIGGLWDDPERRADLRRRGLEWAAGWTWERCARATLDVLERAGRQPVS